MTVIKEKDFRGQHRLQQVLGEIKKERSEQKGQIVEKRRGHKSGLQWMEDYYAFYVLLLFPQPRACHPFRLLAEFMIVNAADGSNCTVCFLML